MKLSLWASAGLLLWPQLATAASDCSCVSGFDPNVMPKMNVTNFVASAYANGSSIYSFDLNYWPDVPPASCGATLHGQPGTFVSVWGDQYCWDKGNGSFVPIWWFWNQSWPDPTYDLRVEAKYISLVAHWCNECLEYGTHTVSSGDLPIVGQTIAYTGRKSFAIRPKTVHG
ncbi:hypothetical protein B0T22DRAFT_537127 [Podospora appendiculata]|uniref:Secreted protein n=1 Tax=Podospora appendiculata TaxID=314037 RepID=A0AAE0XDB7_9PEZI|nr:hypothetical protein B0T22DRAFT_537127 [Podospora appendiculata]